MTSEGFSNNSMTLISPPHWVHFLSALSARPLRAGCHFPCAHAPVTSAQGVFTFCTGCVSRLHTALVPSAQDDVPSAQRFLSRVAGCSSPLHTVHHRSAQSAHPVCTGHVSLRHMVYASATQGHGHPSSLRDSHRARKSGTECSPTGSCRLLVWVCTQDPPALPPLGAHGGCMVTSNHLCKLSWAFLRGAG